MTDLLAIQEGLANYLEGLSHGLDPGRFRFCLEGSLAPTEGKEAQVSTCFAMKAAWQAGIWEKWPEEKRLACIEFLKSFQRSDGWFADPWLEKASRPDVKAYLRHARDTLCGRSSWGQLFDRAERNLRAETRQTAATLLMVGVVPPYPLPCEHTTEEGLKTYLEKFDWRQPWGSGSHLSHLIFFLSINQRSFGLPRDYDELIDIICNFLASRRDSETGCWFRGSPPDVMKINGAMKVFSGLQWVDRPYPDCNRLLDFALGQPFQSDGCGFLNRLFVVHEAIKGAPDGYRRDQVQDLARKALEAIVRFRKPDGGFSFYQGHAMEGYYGATVSRGLPVSDLHGTCMMVWAIALAIEMLGDNAPPGREQWKAHRA
jgi:hypothetical protein